MPCILLLEIQYLLKFVSTNPPFLSCPSDTKIQAAIVWWQLQQKISLGFYFLTWKSQDCAINCKWIIQRRLIDCPSDTVFNFGIPQAPVVVLAWPVGLNASWRYNTYLFPILRQNKQKPIRNICRSNLWPTPILMLSYTEFKILRKKPGDKAFRGFIQNSHGADEIKDLPISIDFQV